MRHALAQLLWISLAAALTTAHAAPTKLNVLLLLVDDLRPVSQSFGGPVSMPSLDALAQRGYRFVNNYANVPVCGASRASLLSGLQPTSQRFLTYNSRLDQDAPDAISLPAWFKQHGYHTQGIGKIFDVIEDSADGWSQPVWHPEMRWHSPVQSGGRGEHLQKSYIQPLSGGRPPTFERLSVEDDAYPDGEIAAHAVREIERLSAQRGRFFLAVGFRKPHLPFNAPDRYWRDDQPEDSLLPATWHEPGTDLPGRARHRSLELRLQYDALPLLGEPNNNEAAQLVRAYHAAARYVDALIADVTQALARSPAADNTLIVIAGDHGFFLGEQRMWTKHALFETALRTPLVIVDPRRQGREVRAITDLLDVYPTLTQLSGLPLPPHLEGNSLVPKLDNPTLPTEPAISRWLNGESIRDERYRYTVWFDESGNAAERMLFDLQRDPLEKQNIVDDAHVSAVVAKLDAQLAERRAGSPWSEALADSVQLNKFANSTVGSVITAVMIRPQVAIGVALVIVLLIGAWVVRRLYRRRAA